MSNKKKNLNKEKAKSQSKAFNLTKEKKKKIIIISACALAFVIVCGIALSFVLNPQEKVGTGASEYLETRDISGRDIKYVEICVENYGTMVVLLDATTAPKTVENFLKLVNMGFYDGLTFHRVKNDFMIQGGDPKANGTGESSYTVKGEFAYNGHYNDIKHKYGVISMSRKEDYDSATCQFFICNGKDATHLDGYYAAFGYVVEGMSVVDKITEETAEYASAENNYIISDKAKQPVIKYIKELSSWSK